MLAIGKKAPTPPLAASLMAQKAPSVPRSGCKLKGKVLAVAQKLAMHAPDLRLVSSRPQEPQLEYLRPQFPAQCVVRRLEALEVHGVVAGVGFQRLANLVPASVRISPNPWPRLLERVVRHLDQRRTAALRGTLSSARNAHPGRLGGAYECGRTFMQCHRLHDSRSM